MFFAQPGYSHVDMLLSVRVCSLSGAEVSLCVVSDRGVPKPTRDVIRDGAKEKRNIHGKLLLLASQTMMKSCDYIIIADSGIC